MKIVQVIPYYYPIHKGGLEKIAQTLSAFLNQEDGYEVLTIASNIGTGGVIRDTDFLIPSIELVPNFPIPTIWSKSFWDTLHMLKEYKPDVIITHTRFFVQSFIGGVLAKRLGCKWVHIEHGSGFVKGYPWYIKSAARLFDQTLGRWIFKHCDEIVTISHAHKKFIQKFTKKDPIVIYNPIDYQSQPQVQNDVPHIGFVGRLVPLKGVDILLQALSAIKDLPRTCTIVGEGSERKQLENLALYLDLSKRVTFVGADDRSNWLHTFDVFVNPSYQEGVPTTVIEALLSHCIVVATDVGGTREISDKEDLLLVESGNSMLLAVALRKALSHTIVAGSSFDLVQEKFNPEKILAIYKAVLQKVVS